MKPVENPDLKPALKLYCQRVLGYFELKGAERVEADILQPAETLLDLYGEEIRGRAYITQDPLRGEMVLRPDFTVPVMRRHIEHGASPSRYCYSGEVFRVREDETSSPSESLQVGYELFSDTDLLEADAEVLAVVKAALDGFPVVPVMGDMAILAAAVASLETSDRRREMLLRHLPRPKRFKELLLRFGAQDVLGSVTLKAVESGGLPSEVGDVPGLRSMAEIQERLQQLRNDAQTPPISTNQIDLIQHLLGVSAPIPHAISQIRDASVDLKHPDFDRAIDVVMRRLDALTARGISLDEMRFDVSYQHTSMEYYSGFVFAFLRHDTPFETVVATGGRYDQLTAFFSGGGRTPAVGGVIRPQVLGDLLC